MARILLCCAALILLIATGLGALASHAFDGVLAEPELFSLRTAVAFQFYHGLGALGAAVLLDRHPRSAGLKAAGAFFVVGVVLFCGSIYATTLAELAWAGPAAPAGGLCFMAGWIALAAAALRMPRQSG